jgi:hypothetical protein
MPIEHRSFENANELALIRKRLSDKDFLQRLSQTSPSPGASRCARFNSARLEKTV